jgi:hypothetical protein
MTSSTVERSLDTINLDKSHVSSVFYFLRLRCTQPRSFGSADRRNNMSIATFRSLRGQVQSADSNAATLESHNASVPAA